MFALAADDPVWLLTHLLRQDSGNIHSLATRGYFKKNSLRKIRLDLCRVYVLPESRVRIFDDVLLRSLMAS